MPPFTTQNIKGPMNWRDHPSDQPSNYLPAGPPEPLLFEQFNGINTSTTRPGVAQDKMAWCDGFMPLGDRYLRTLYGVGDRLAIDGSAIVFFQFINIGSTPYAIVVNSDGSIHAANTETYTATEIAPAGTITNPSRLTVGMSQYGSLYVLIVALQTNGYFIWDGTTFFRPGDPGPDGGTMPTAIGGTTIETYAGRIWIGVGDLVVFSVVGSLVDFSSGNGGGDFSSSDSFLRVRYVQLLQTNGFLYLVADSSINYVSGVQTSGTPPVTTFTNQNADPEVGSPWPSTVGTFGRNILFANAFGAHASYGAAVNKISDDLDGVYNTVENFGGLIPSAAKAIIFGKKTWMLLLPIIDPISGAQVNKLMMWNGQAGQNSKWWTSPQDVALTYIQSQEIDSVLTAWGTDGMALYPLFQEPSTAFTKTVQSRLWDAPLGLRTRKTVGRLWGAVQYFAFNEPDLSVSIDNETESAENDIVTGPATIQWVNNAAADANWVNNAALPALWRGQGVGIAVFEPTQGGQQGVYIGLTVTTECDDMALIQFALAPEIAAYRG